MQRDAVAQSNPSAEYSASFDVFVCQIDPSNSTLIPGGRKSRGAAKATSNVEKVIFCRKTKLIEKIYSGLTATDVELINRGKVINGYRVNRFTKRSHPQHLSQQSGSHECNAWRHPEVLASRSSRKSWRDFRKQRNFSLPFRTRHCLVIAKTSVGQNPALSAWSKSGQDFRPAGAPRQARPSL